MPCVCANYKKIPPPLSTLISHQSPKPMGLEWSLLVSPNWGMKQMNTMSTVNLSANIWGDGGGTTPIPSASTPS